MTGIVRLINRRKGFFAVETRNGDYSIFEAMSFDEIGIGDEVAWADDTALGSEQLTNRTRSESGEVYFQNHHIAPAYIRSYMQ